MELTREIAEMELKKAGQSNPGPWTDHSRYTAKACENIARCCPNLNPDTAYILGLMHDIGRYPGVTKERHLIDGYRYCISHGWTKAAQICITHSYMIQDINTSVGTFDMPDSDYHFIKTFLQTATYDDYDRLVQLCDALALPTGFCLLEKRFVDVALRYGTHPATVPRWQKTLALKTHFETQTHRNLYDLLPGIVENTFK